MNLNGGYAMIKYNSTQEELQIAYRSKKPALFYDENQRAHWAVIEETATQSVDEETQEQITLYEYSYRLLNDINVLVDNKGKPAVAKGIGFKYADTELELVYSKWYLNGDILALECAGYYTNNIGSGMPLVYFEIPEYISNRIITAPSGAIDLMFQIYANDIFNGIISKVYLHKHDNTIRFITIDPINVTDTPYQFRMHYDIILDNYSE